ncbi:uncharacterized protein LOC123690990 [Colias croceus]|uniref:uncharacterized protein LOC123690990 n=1 Tax=Colias crocea TaxID=72248 RepID=UPI001E27BDC5|nr:uncharacterized protein LOC123690990 [Colias croceus]
MIIAYILASLLLILPNECKRTWQKCPHGEQAVCGNDGNTYNNICDLETVQYFRTNLTVRYIGSCNYLIDTLLKISMQPETKKSLRIRWSIGFGAKFGSKKNKMKLVNYMINTQKNIGAFQFKHNNINTQGNNNRFGIDIL